MARRAAVPSGQGWWPGSGAHSHVLSVRTAASASLSASAMNPVRSVTWATGASLPKFQTTAATRLRPGFRNGAMSKVSKRQ